MILMTLGGTTKEFCGDKQVKAPSCGGTSSNERTIGYYEGWSHTRSCDTMSPEEIPIGSYTHLNFAFAFINPSTYAVAPMDQDQVGLYKRVTKLKSLNPGMQVWIAVGGWSMNTPLTNKQDPDQATHDTFSNLAGSTAAQAKFFSSLISFMQNYGFDGVDIDWEYPVASERSGKKADYANAVTFLENLRKALGSSGHNYGLSITLPSSYWYLQHFDIVKMAKTIDWFNMMSYDLHGTWDSTNKWIGPIVQAHTNLTEIDLALSLLWRNDIDPGQVVLGLGFYGRSFTLSDPGCSKPGCAFSGGGNAGECTNNVGTLSYAEITRIIAKGATVTTDQDAGVKQAVYGGNQWVSYDDADTLKIKVDYANKHCLGGTMVWAVDLDDGEGSAAAALSKSTGRKDIALSAKSPPFRAGGACFITECTKTPSCPSGYGAVQQINGDKQNVKIEHGCGKGEKRTYCCPADDMPTCQWRGSAPACNIKSACSSDEIILTSDTGGGCSSGHKNLCCKQKTSNKALTQCVWKGSGPRCERDNKCPSEKPTEIARSPTGDNQQECDVYGFGESQHKQLKVLCCTEPPPYTGCDWYTKGTQDPPPHPRPAHCSGKCPSGKVLIATDSMCFSGGTRALCCDPPNTYNDNYMTDFKNKLLSFADDHTCPATQIFGPAHAKRSKPIKQNDRPNPGIRTSQQIERSNVKARFATGRHNMTVGTSNLGIMARDFKSLGGFETLQILYAALPLGTQLSGLVLEAFNDVIGSKANLLVKDLKAAAGAGDPYDDPLFSLAWMLCEWNQGPRLLQDQSDTEEICVLPPDNYDFSGVGGETNDDPQQKRKRDLRLSKTDLRTYEWLDEQVANLSKRVFFQDHGATERHLSSMPATGLLMQAVMDDDLPLLYIQRIRYQAHIPGRDNQDTILEVAYDLRGRP
ncbi:MAG: hypothetical protein Q9226_001309 [Calogaya cf. arnoldii]